MNKRLVHAATLLPLAVGAANMIGTSTSSNINTSTARTLESSGPVLFAGEKLACTLPFDAIKLKHPIDESCPFQGAATKDPQIAQNRAKNNFCASGNPADLILDDFGTLQKIAASRHVSFGSDAKVPPDRSKLEEPMTVSSGNPVAEGDEVRVVAYVIDAHASDVGSGESVNCKVPGPESNDIHVVLGESPTADPCTSVTAEISPHYRPESWTPTAVNKLSGRPLRFTGQLFFDASHSPCQAGKRANPPRRSLFEVHPAYSVEVCALDPSSMDETALLQACRTTEESNWIALEDWSGSEESDSTENDE